MKKLVKLLFPMALVGAAFGLMSACDETPPSTGPVEKTYTKTFTNKDDTYTYKLVTYDGTSGVITLYDSENNKLLDEHVVEENGKYTMGNDGQSGYTMSLTVSGETFDFDGYSHFPGFVMPYETVAGTYSVIMPDGSDSPGTITFNADGTGSISYRENGEFTYYTVEGNRAIIVIDDMDGEYVEFTEQGINQVGSVYSPADYVYFNSFVYDNDRYEVVKSGYGVSHLGVVGEGFFYYNDDGAYRVDHGYYQYVGLEESIEVDNIYFGKAEFQEGNKFTFTSQNMDGYGYEMEKSVVEDKHYVTIKYETYKDKWDETCFDYQSEKIVKNDLIWRDYYFEMSSYTYEEDGEFFGAEGKTEDREDGYKTLMALEELALGTGPMTTANHHVVDVEKGELKYIFVEYGNYIHYDGVCDPVILERSAVNGVQPQIKQEIMLLDTRRGNGYLYAKSDEKVYVKLGYYTEQGDDGLIYYSAVMYDDYHGSLQGFMYIDREKGKYIEIDSFGNRDLENDLFNASLLAENCTFYEAVEGEELEFVGAVVYDYNDGENAYVFLYNFYLDEPTVAMYSLTGSYEHVEVSDGEEMRFSWMEDGSTTTIVIKLTGAEKKITSIIWA